MKSFQLIQRCEAGEAGAIEEFVRTYQPNVYCLALSILDDPDEADEVAQDALVTALDRLASFRGEAAFTTWLYAITLNLCRGRLRKRRSRERLAPLLLDVFHMHTESLHPEVQVQKVEADAALRRREYQRTLEIMFQQMQRDPTTTNYLDYIKRLNDLHDIQNPAKP